MALTWLNYHAFPGVACIILMVYLMFTSLWPLSTLYLIWQLNDWQTPERGKILDIMFSVRLLLMKATSTRKYV